jgi:hypothetical protein
MYETYLNVGMSLGKLLHTIEAIFDSRSLKIDCKEEADTDKDKEKKVEKSQMSLITLVQVPITDLPCVEDLDPMTASYTFFASMKSNNMQAVYKCIYLYSILLDALCSRLQMEEKDIKLIKP